MNALILLAVVLLLYLLSVWILRRFALQGLICTRGFSKPVCFEGDAGEMVEIVRNDRPFFIPWLRVESSISPFIRLGRQENLNVSDHSRCCSIFSLMPYQQIRRVHHVTFLRRGEYDLGSASLTAGDLLGLCEVHRQQQMSVPVLIWPRLIDDEDLPPPLSQLMDESVSRRQLLTDPFLFRGVRPYQFGDPVRDIHWPASARTGETHVRLYDYSTQSRLLVVLNGEIRSDQWGDRITESEQEAIEYGISLAASLCLRALRSGCAAGFASNMSLSGSSAVLLPANDSGTDERILCALARLKIVRTLRFATFLSELKEISGTNILVLSCCDNAEIQAALSALRSRDNRVYMHLINGGKA